MQRGLIGYGSPPTALCGGGEGWELLVSASQLAKLVHLRGKPVWVSDLVKHRHFFVRPTKDDSRVTGSRPVAPLAGASPAERFFISVYPRLLAVPVQNVPIASSFPRTVTTSFRESVLPAPILTNIQPARHHNDSPGPLPLEYGLSLINSVNPIHLFHDKLRSSLRKATGMLGSKATIEPSQSLNDTVFRIIDAACIFAALRLAVYATETMPNEFFWLVGAVGAVLFNIISGFCGMYRNWRGAAVEREAMCGLTTWFFTFVALLGLGYATSLPDQIARSTTVYWFVFTAAFIASNRIIIRAMQRMVRKHGLNSRQYAIVGITELAFQLVENIDSSPEMGLSLHGFYDDRPSSRTPAVPDKMSGRVGDLDQLVEAARNREIEQIFITFPMRAEDRIRAVLNRLSDSTATVYLVPDFFVFELLHSRWTNIGGLPAVSIFEKPFYGVDGAVKRVMDIVLAAFGLLLFALPMAFIAVLIKRTSPGPVFFRQRRYGLDGREIHVWKFRSMTVCEDGDSVTQAKKHDTRVTRIGAFLRTSSLDEIPQLFNVLGGGMSLVGPRPHATAHNEHYRALIQGYMLRHKVRPGITGLAQVNGCRGETDTLDKMQRRIEFDHRYIREWSVWMDVRILLQTVLVVLSRDDAY